MNKFFEKINNNPFWMFLVSFAGILGILPFLYDILRTNVILKTILYFGMLNSSAQFIISYIIQFIFYLSIFSIMYFVIKKRTETDFVKGNPAINFLSSLKENDLKFLLRGEVVQDMFICNTDAYILYHHPLNLERLKSNKGYVIRIPAFKSFTHFQIKVHLNEVKWYCVIAEDEQNKIKPLNDRITILQNDSMRLGYVEIVIFLEEDVSMEEIKNLDRLKVTLETCYLK